MNYSFNDLNLTNFLEYDSSNISEHFDAIKRSKNDDYLLIDDLTFIEFNKANKISGVKLLKNVIYPTTIPYAQLNCYFLRKAFERKLKQMHVAGLIDHYMKEYADRKYLELIEEDEGPQKLRLDQLAIGFEACLVFLGLATFIFLLEVLLFLFKKRIELLAAFVRFLRR